MSSFLTSDGKPFFGGTYFPRESFMDLLRKAAAAWRDQRPKLVEQAGQISERVALMSAAAGEAVEVGSELVSEAVRQSLGRHDDRLVDRPRTSGEVPLRRPALPRLCWGYAQLGPVGRGLARAWTQLQIPSAPRCYEPGQP